MRFRRCPLDPGGTHHMDIPEGYSPAWCGFVVRCACGEGMLFPSDQMSERLERA